MPGGGRSVHRFRSTRPEQLVACPNGCPVRWPAMDSPTGSYPTAPRLPLVTLDEAREAVRLLQHFADDSPEGRDAGVWAADMALRLPSE